MSQVFSFAYKVGWHFVAGKVGTGGNYLITNSGSDEPGTPVLVETVWPWQGLLFMNCQFMGATIQIKSSNTAPIKFTSCAFVGNPAPSNLGYPGTDTIIQVDGGSLKLDQSDIYMWAQTNTTAPAISVGPNARAIVTNSEFRKGNGDVAVRFESGARGIFSNNMCENACNSVNPEPNPNVIISQNIGF